VKVKSLVSISLYLAVLEQGVHLSWSRLREVGNLLSATTHGICQRVSDEHKLSTGWCRQNSKCSAYPQLWNNIQKANYT